MTPYKLWYWPTIQGRGEYLASGRRIPFNDEGIFRHYPELDAA